MPVAFAGGGAELFGRRLYSNEVNTITILDRFANAKGYKLLLLHVVYIPVVEKEIRWAKRCKDKALTPII